MPAVHLTYREVRAAARKAYEEERLGFQRGAKTCSYYDKETDSVCAIGASLSHEDAERFDRALKTSGGSHIEALVRDGLVSCPIYGDAEKLKTLQRAHDRLVSCESNQYYHKRLLDLIYAED